MQSDIEKKVMASVGTIYAARKLTGVTAVRLYVLCASLIAIATLVSVPDVIANLMQVRLGDTGTFVLSAILNTKLLVQLAVFMSVVVGAWFALDIMRPPSDRRLAL
jgi:hypothetical protein